MNPWLPASTRIIISRRAGVWGNFLPPTATTPARFRRRLSLMATSSMDGNGLAPQGSESTASASSAIDFLTLCHRLKTTKRTGWVLRDVKGPESIADHMYRMGLMALVAADIPGVDRDKCVKMAIVHDIAEAIVGDITPSDGISKAEKSRREREALEHMCNLLGGGSRAKEINELWTEYEENSSPEAKVVKDLDKVEMILQALEYENGARIRDIHPSRYGGICPIDTSEGINVLAEIYQGKDLDEFFQSTAGKFQTELGKAWAAEIASRRKQH